MNARAALKSAIFCASLAFPAWAQETPDCAAEFARAKQVIPQLDALGAPVADGMKCSFANGTGPWGAPVQPVQWWFVDEVLNADLNFAAGPDAGLPMKISMAINAFDPDNSTIFLSVTDKSAASQGIFGSMVLKLKGLQTASLLAMQETKQTALTHTLKGRVTINEQTISSGLRALVAQENAGPIIAEVQTFAANAGGKTLIPGAAEALRQFAAALPKGQGTFTFKVTSEEGVALYALFAMLIFGEAAKVDVAAPLQNLRIGATWHPDTQP